MIQINKDTRTTGDRQFSPKATIYNGLSLGKLVEIKVDELDTVDSASKWISFRGYKPPRLSFKFVEVTKDGEPGNYYHSFIPIDAKGEKTKEKADAMSSMVGHFLEVIRGNKDVQLTPKDEKGNPVDVATLEGDALMATWKRFFEDIAAAFVTTDKKLYSEGSTYWMKLLLYNNARPVNNNNPGFPMYPGEGVIEKFVDGKPSKLSIKIEKGESITPMPKTANATPSGIPPAMGNGAPASAPSWFQQQ